MIVAGLTQEQVDQIAKDFAPDVIRIRFHVGEDWAEEPAVFFRILLSDAASQPGRLFPVTRAVRQRLHDDLGFPNPDLLPYFRFRSQSEQAAIQDPAWD